METISKYTSDEATEDGILFDITTVNPDWKRGIFSHVTTNLMHEGYFAQMGIANIPNLLDLLNQANDIVRHASDDFTKHNSFFSGDIELPSGRTQKVFIEQNEMSKFTIMLPADH